MIRTIEPGRYEVKVYAGRDPMTGRERRLSRTIRGTKREARDLERRMLDTVRDGFATAPRTVGEIFDRWLETARVEDSTVRQRRWAVESRLRPRIGAVRLSALTPAMLDKLYRDLEREGSAEQGPLSSGSALQMHTMISSALNLAVEWGWLRENPARKAHPPTETSTEVVVPSVAEVRKLIENAPPALATILRVLAATGMRRGEACALRCSDVQGATIRKVRAVSIGENGPYLKPTKTKVRQRISLDATTVEAIVEHDWSERQKRADLGITMVHDPYLFSLADNRGEPLHPTVLSHDFAELRDRLGLDVRMKNFRHFHATQLLAAGVPITVVAGRLGHARPATTLNIYAGWLPSSDESAAVAIEDILR